MTPERIRGLAVAALIVATSLVVIAPLLTANALPIGSDVVFATDSAKGFVQGLGEGVLYPRWVDRSNHGFGGPTFIYYPPLPFYAVAGARLLTADLIGAFVWVLLTAVLLSGWALYAAARPLAGRFGAALGAVLYVLAPYHVLDLYDRFAFAEFCAFVWIPWIVLALRRTLLEERANAWLGLAAAFTGLLSTHLVSAFMGVLVLGPYALWLVAGARSWRRLARLALPAAVALLASAAFWLPMLAQRGEVHLEWIVESPHGQWPRNFAFRDETARGYEPAPIKHWVNRSVATQGALALAAAALFLAAGRCRRTDVEMPAPVPDRSQEGRAWIGLSLWTVVLQIPLSAPLWRFVPELETVQFPWRFGLYQAVAMAMLTACAAGAARSAATVQRRSRLSFVTAFGLALAAVPALLLSARLMDHPDRPIDFRSAYVGAVPSVMTEYLPQGMVGWQGFRELEPGRIPAAFLDAPGRIELESWKTHRRVFRIEASAPGGVEVRTFYHPGWRAWIDGAEVPIDADNPRRAITVAVPAGSHRLEVAFESTADRLVGAVASWLGLAVLAAAAGQRLLRRCDWARLAPGRARKRPARLAAAAPVWWRLAGVGAVIAAILAAVLLLAPLFGRRPQGWNTLFISVDTLRADHVGLYGYDRPTSPRIDGLGGQGVVFTQMICQNPNTNPSHTSMFTGLYPRSHGNLDNRYRLDEEVPILAETLKRVRYETGAFVSGYTLKNEVSGLARGFDTYDDDFPGRERRGDETTDRALDWLRQHAGRPFFLFVHLFDPHGPYDPPADRPAHFAPRTPPRPVPVERIPLYQRLPRGAPEGEVWTDVARYEARYDEEIAFADAQVGRLLDELDRLGLAGRTLVVFTSDHGESLDERFHPLDHGAGIGDEEIRVPFVLRFPDGRFAGQRFDGQSQLIDLAPTLAGLLGVELPGLVQGVDLVPWLSRADGEPHEYAFIETRMSPERWADRPYRFREGDTLKAVRRQDAKLVVFPGEEGSYVELYDLLSDPSERHDIAQLRPDLTRRLGRQLQRLLLMPQRRNSLATEARDPAVLRQLRDLGYLD